MKINYCMTPDPRIRIQALPDQKPNLEDTTIIKYFKIVK